MRYRTILLIADPAMRITNAWHRAERLARTTGATLHVEIFDDSRAVRAIGAVSPKVADVLTQDLIKQRELWLRRRAERLQAIGVKAHVRVTWGAPIRERIIERIAEIEPDLVVKDVHLEPLLKRVLFTPLDRHLLRLCPAPLLMVRGGARRLPTRVIAAVDTAHPLPGSDALNERIVETAGALAHQCDAQLHLVHSFEDLLPVTPAEVVTAEVFSDAYEQLRRIHRERFNRFASVHEIPPERRHFIYGPSAMALTDFASHAHTDVLVLGTTHRTGLDRLMLGSTAEEILGDLRCDLLAVKPEEVAAARMHQARTPRRASQVRAEPLSLG